MADTSGRRFMPSRNDEESQVFDGEMQWRNIFRDIIRRFLIIHAVSFIQRRCLVPATNAAAGDADVTLRAMIESMKEYANQGFDKEISHDYIINKIDKNEIINSYMLQINFKIFDM